MLLKYLFDRLVALVGLMVLWPVLLVVAILIKVKMPGGPVLFVQKRVGKDGKLFDCHKFRSMRPVPDPTLKGGETGWSSISVAGESRITPLGAKLRHYKLDELPELWDVFIGNMSFVGPRPDVPGYADALEGEEREVLKLRPGITGPATMKYRDEEEQIAEFISEMKNEELRMKNGIPTDYSDEQVAVWYNDTVLYPDKVRLNRYYLHHYSFIKDIQMIVYTVLGKHMMYGGERI